MNNKSKINTSKGKLYLTVVAFAALFMTAFGVNANMNSNMNAYASIFSDIQNVDDVGQSLECVIVVVGCDAQGSVGSSGDVNIGVGDNDTTTDGDDPTPLPPLEDCEVCLATLTPAQLVSLRVALELGPEASLADICVALGLVATVEALIVILDEAGLSVTAIVDLLACLGIDVDLLGIDVDAVLGGIV